MESKSVYSLHVLFSTVFTNGLPSFNRCSKSDMDFIYLTIFNNPPNTYSPAEYRFVFGLNLVLRFIVCRFEVYSEVYMQPF